MIKRVLLVDDHKIVREGLKHLISMESDLACVDEASSGDEAIYLVKKNSYDVVVLDISMPKKNGVDTMFEIQRIAPNLPVLALSGFHEQHYAINLMRNGCRGYIAKDAESDEIMRAIRAVANGKRFISPNLADLFTQSLIQRESVNVHESLSSREFQIFIALASGRSSNAISKELNISVKTISTYRSRVLIKMGLTTNAALTHYAIKNGLLN